MNILYHHRTQGHGAEGVHITGIVRGFEKFGHRVTVISPPGVDPLKTAGSYLYSPAKSGLSKFWKSISRSCPQIVFEMIELVYNGFQLRRMARFLKREKFDLIYERYAFFLWATVWLARRRGVPVILEVNEIAGIKRARPLILSGLARWMERAVFRRATFVVTVSGYLKDRIAEQGIEREKIIVMPNGVDHRLFSPSVSGAEARARHGMKDDIVIGFVGWIDPWDNLPGLLEVFRDLVRRRPGLKLMLVGDIAGKGVDPNLVGDMVKRLSLEEHVVHLRRVPRPEMPAHIAAMDVCVIPDSNAFGSPVVLFEFMASGKAVVAPSVGPVLDVLTDGDNGAVFKAHDGASMAAAISRVVEDADLRARMSRRARECVEQKHNWEANAAAALALVEK